MDISPFPRHRVYNLRVGSCGGVSSPLSLPIPVNPLISLEIFLTRIPHCLGSIFIPAAFSALFGAPLGNGHYPGTELPLDCSYRLTIIEASLYFLGAH